MRPAWLVLVRLALAAATIFAVTMALLPHAPDLTSNDKVGHMLAFTTLTLLSALAYPQAPLLRIAERLSFLGALIEVFQSIPALHRDCDVRDWIADTVAILAVLAVVAMVRALIRRPRAAI